MQRFKPWRAAIETIGIVVATTAMAWAADEHASASTLALLYIAAVLLIAYRQAIRWAIAAGVLAVIVLNVLFVHPRGALRVDSQEHGLVLVALLAVALLAAWLAHRQRTFRAAAERQSQQAIRLSELARDLSALSAPDDMLPRTLDHLRQQFGLAAIVTVQPEVVEAHTAGLPAKPLPSTAYTLWGDTRAGQAAPTLDALLHCATSAAPMGAGTLRWPSLKGCYAPLRSGDLVLGALGVARRHAAATDDIAALTTIADVLTAALVRAQHAADAAQARASADIQALRTTLLASVSHDLRTPLAAILGAASSLVHQRDRLTSDDARRLAEHIEQEARYLANVTDNTLHWLRLSDGHADIHADWESVQDLLASAVQRFRQRPEALHISLQCAPDLPLLHVDGVMITQALSNLLDNALKYSPGEIGVQATRYRDRVWVDVTDRGATLTAQDRVAVCDTFHRLPAHAGIRGTGLGLAIARAIMLAHRGELSVHAKAGGGNLFRLALPIPEQPLAPPL